MKNKSTIYILIGVAVIWGIAGYKFYDKFFAEKENITTTVQDVVAVKSSTQTESFDLIADYRDPFLKNAVNEVVESSPSLPSPEVKIEKPIQIKPIIRWPQIKVGGIVNKKFMGMISNKSVLINLGKEEMGVTFTKVSRDSVWLKFSGEQKGFALKY